VRERLSPFWPLTHPMPRRWICVASLLLGSGPIRDRARPANSIISGTMPQALRMRVSRWLLVNSNPASIMTQIRQMARSHPTSNRSPRRGLRQVHRTVSAPQMGPLLPPWAAGTALKPGGGPGRRRHPLSASVCRAIGANLQAIQKAETRRLFKRRWSASAVADVVRPASPPRGGKPSGVGEEIGHLPPASSGRPSPSAAPWRHRYNPKEFQAFCKSA